MPSDRESRARWARIGNDAELRRILHDSLHRLLVVEVTLTLLLVWMIAP